MSRACVAPVRAALKEKGAEKAFSDQEIEDLVARLAQRRKAKGGAADEAAWAEAAAELTKEEMRGLLIDRRARLAAERAKKRRHELIDGMGGALPQRLSAFMVGDEKIGRGRGLSVDAIGRALQVDLWGQVEKGLREADLYDRVAAWWRGADKAFEERVAVEMARLNGGPETATGDAEAVKVAEVFNAAVERGRQLQNAEGAWIAKLEGYTVRQQHDPIKVAGGFWREFASVRAVREGGLPAVRQAALARGFERWRSFIEPLLDERTFAELADELDLPADFPLPAAADVRGRFMQRVWWDITTGKHSQLQGLADYGDFRPPPSKARSISASRVLHFKDARAALAYQRQFGQPSLFAAVMGDLSRAAQNTALMRGFGPAPEAAFAAEAERLGSQAVTSARLKQQFAELDGSANAPESARGALIGRMIRLDQSLSKLGGMVLSAFSDMPVATQTLARAGVDFLEGYGAVMKGLARTPESREVADLLDVGARAASGSMSARFVASDGPTGWGAVAMRAFYKVNGFEFWNEGVRNGVGQMLAAHLGREAAAPWAALRQGTRETLERYGIDAGGWDILRQGALEMEDGRRYLTFEAVEGAADADLLAWAGKKGSAKTAKNAARAREELALRYRAMFHDVLDTAVSESRAREQSSLVRGTRPGTIVGEAVRLFTQFWAFPVTFVGRQLGPAMGGYAGRAPAALMAHLILSMTVFGFVSMQAKQLAKGREPRPLTDENGRPDLDVFLAAMLQGGGLGIYGDFLFGEYNRFGGSPIGTLGGPAVGEFERVLRLFSQLRDGEDAGAEAFRFALGNTPFVNLWYTRAALDYTLFWRMQEWLSPGWAGRYQARVEKETGSEFILAPTEAVN